MFVYGFLLLELLIPYVLPNKRSGMIKFYLFREPHSFLIIRRSERH